MKKVWVVRQGCKKGKGEYLWGFVANHSDDRQMQARSIYESSSWTPKRKPDWGTQDGASRYENRVSAVRAARDAGGRVVRLRLTLTADSEGDEHGR